MGGAADPSDVADITRRYLMYLLLPTWFVPPVLLLMAAAVVIPQATAWWDVQVAVDSGREIRRAEQHIHSFLEVILFMAFAGVACLHWRPVPKWRAPASMMSAVSTSGRRGGRNSPT